MSITGGPFDVQSAGGAAIGSGSAYSSDSVVSAIAIDGGDLTLWHCSLLIKEVQRRFPDSFSRNLAKIYKMRFAYIGTHPSQISERGAPLPCSPKLGYHPPTQNPGESVPCRITANEWKSDSREAHQIVQTSAANAFEHSALLPSTKGT
jgi:hypothetical protein